ncbi:MAG: ATP-binding protein [Bacteroidota bacterium]
MIERTLEKKIRSRIGTGKAIMIVGPRQVGKTTLINKLLQNEDVKFFDGDDPVVRTQLTRPNTEELRQMLEGKKIVFVDEGQLIDDIGRTMKIIVDQFKDVQVWISGSSSFDLYDRMNEPLTGRKWAYELFPISWEEYENHVGYLKSEQQLELRLIFGFYPDVIQNIGSENVILNNLNRSYLYQDVLAFGDLRKPAVLDNLVRALALQVGHEVNYNKLSRLLKVDRKTIERYIDILEKAYIIFKLPSYSRNLRNEIQKGRKIYFYDNGIRNTIIGNFDPLNLRPDTGALWENFLVSERIKQKSYKLNLSRSYFWRTKQQQEIDYVEERGQEVVGYEFKWKSKKAKSLPKTFLKEYNATGKNINRSNFREFVVIQNS